MVLRFLMFAGIFFLISCGEIERNNPDDPSSPNYQGSGGVSPPLPPSSSSTVPSSGSIAESSSSVAASSSSSVSIQSSVVYGPDVEYGGEIYKTVVIGTQTWFKRNLNRVLQGSKCGNGIDLSDSHTTTCFTYGRLYNWATAMSLPASCNSSSCGSQVQTKHKGICPQGWHIPSDADWNTLMKYVNPSCSDNSSCTGAGTKLKATSGWNEGGNGEDTYGFSALPGGYGNTAGSFGNVGGSGYWWSTSEGVSHDAYYWGMYYDYDLAHWNDDRKYFLFSVRCLQD